MGQIALLQADTNRIMGRFDVCGIVEQPARQPQIEVTFRLDANRVLNVSAVDLDAGRHAEWAEQKGRIVVYE